jgi:ankyrin repeat protein
VDLRGIDDECFFDGGGTPLTSACLHNDVKMVRALVRCGANVNMLNDDGCTPLAMATLVGHLEIATILMEDGAEVDGILEGEDPYVGLSPLMAACYDVNRESVR